eukprot:m51a1_g9982 putative dynein regulatory complex protein 1 (681) ;mRNA; r:19440-21969
MENLGSTPAIHTFSVDSTDREERILARRARLDKKQAAEKEKKKASEQAASGAASQTQDEYIQEERHQIETSFDAIDLKRRVDYQAISGVRVANCAAETLRRAVEQKRRDDLRAKAAKEKSQSEALVAQVRATWPQIIQAEVAETLQKSIEEQQAKSDEIMAGRERTIKAYKQAIKAKSDEYQKSLAKQAEDIDTLLAASHTHSKELIVALNAQLEVLEAWYEAARTKLREENEAKLEALYRQRQELEQKMVEARLEQTHDSERMLDDVYRRDAAEAATVKARLEEEVQALQQNLQALRATYMLNSEKIDYNMRLLAQREAMHTERIASGKTRINRLQDSLTSLRTRYNKVERQHKQKTAELADEYSRIVALYKDLNSKFNHFQVSDAKHLEEVWTMNRLRAQELVGKLQTADRVIHERVLGLSWAPPERDVFQDPPVLADIPGMHRTVNEATGAPKLAGQLEEHVMQLICDEAGFLIESKIDNLLSSSAEEPTAVASILKALQISERADIEKLMSFFVGVVEAPEDEQSSYDPVTLTVTRGQVVAALNAFIKEHEKTSKSLLRQRDKEERQQMLEDERVQLQQFWQRVENVIDASGYRTWKMLMQELGSYNAVLQRRLELLDETNRLRDQNAEMKAHLNQLLTDPSNGRFQLPPVEMEIPPSMPPTSSLSGGVNGISTTK